MQVYSDLGIPFVLYNSSHVTCGKLRVFEHKKPKDLEAFAVV